MPLLLIVVNAYEMRIYRRILRIPWSQHRTNIATLGQLKIKIHLFANIEQSSPCFFLVTEVITCKRGIQQNEWEKDAAIGGRISNLSD